MKRNESHSYIAVASFPEISIKIFNMENFPIFVALYFMTKLIFLFVSKN